MTEVLCSTEMESTSTSWKKKCTTSDDGCDEDGGTEHFEYCMCWKSS